MIPHHTEHDFWKGAPGRKDEDVLWAMLDGQQVLGLTLRPQPSQGHLPKMDGQTHWNTHPGARSETKGLAQPKSPALLPRKEAAV